MSIGAIPAALGLKKRMIAYNSAGCSPRKDSRGRPKALSPRNLRGPHRLVEDEDPFASMAEPCKRAHTERTSTAAGTSVRKVSAITVRMAAKGFALSSCAPATKPFVSMTKTGQAPAVGKRPPSLVF